MVAAGGGGTFLSVAVCSGVIVGTGAFAEGEYIDTSVSIGTNCCFGGGGGTFLSVAAADGTFLSVAVCSGVIVGTGAFAKGEYIDTSVSIGTNCCFGAGGGTFLSVATEKYPKDRDLRKNHGFPLKIPFLFHEY